MRYSHFYPSLEEGEKAAKIFSTYFENNKLKNETRGLARSVTTRYNAFLKASSVDHAGNKHICNS